MKAYAYPARTTVRPGEVIPVAIVLDHDRRWHTQAPPPTGQAGDPDAIVNAVGAATADGRLLVHADAVQWPTPEQTTVASLGDAPALVYSGRTVAFVPVEVTPDAQPGTTTLSLLLTYQACDDSTCLAPVRDQAFPIVLAIDPAAAVDGGFAQPELFAGWRVVAPRMPPTVAGGPPGTSLVVILTATVVVVGVGGVVVLALLRRRQAPR